MKASSVLLAFALPAAMLAGAASPRAAGPGDTCASGCTYEPEPVFQAPQLAGPTLLTGPNFRVVPEVPVRGFMAHFLIDTPYGPLHADSVQLLAIRVGEIPAIETLENASHKGAFGHALAERGKKTGSAIVNVISHPIDSITGLPMGVVRYFKKQIDTWTGRAQSASDRTGRILENKGDPYRAPPGPMTAAREANAHGRSRVTVGNVTETSETSVAAPPADPNAAVTYGLADDGTPAPPPDADGAAAAGAAQGATVGSDAPAATAPAAGTVDKPAAQRIDDTDEKKSRAWYARAGAEVGRETKRYLKYSQARNELAKFLGVDPNTSNPYVVERLDSLAWAATWGNFSAGEALGQIAGTAADVITDTGLVNQYVLTHTPEQIRDRNEKQLASVCSDEYSIRVFSRRGGFTDTLRTQLTDALVRLKPAAGCNELLELAATTQGEVEARYLVDALALIEKQVTNAKGGKLLIAGAAIAWLTPDGRLALPMAVDYLSWTVDIDTFFQQREFVVGDKTVLVGGDASPLALLRLGERGWRVTLRADYAGAPHYATGPGHTVR